MTKVVKDRYEKDFTIVKNSPLRDPNISLKAKGAFMYLWSLPDDWDFHESEIVKHSTDGQRSLNTAIKELRFHNYIEIHREHTGKTDWILHEVPKAPSHQPHVRNAHMRNAHKRNAHVYKGLNKQSTHSTNEQPKSNAESNPKPNIVQDIIGYFPKVQAGYKFEDMVKSVDQWLKDYSPKEIHSAIDNAQQYQMTKEPIGSPTAFIDGTLRHQHAKAVKDAKRKAEHQQDVDIPDIDKFMANYDKNSKAEDAQIIKECKKKGLI